MRPILWLLAGLVLLGAAPTAGAAPRSEILCESGNPEEVFEETILMIQDELLEGKRCLKVCQDEAAICKKVGTSIRKCKDRAAKAEFKIWLNLCQLRGGDKKTCIETHKPIRQAERDRIQIEFDEAKIACATQLGLCKTACTD